MHILIALGLLLIGSSIYILFRPTTLIMFDWFAYVGGKDLIHFLRASAAGYREYLPAPVIYNLPFALWIISSMMVVEAIWWESGSIWRYLWFWIIPLGSVSSEIAQYYRILPGTFDSADLFIILSSTAFFIRRLK